MSNAGGRPSPISVTCSRCHQIIAVEKAAGPPGWRFRRGLWTCGGCSLLEPDDDPVPNPQVESPEPTRGSSRTWFGGRKR